LRCGAARRLADVAYESFAQAEDRFGLRSGARARWSGASTATWRLGRHADLVAEHEALVARHPFARRVCAPSGCWRSIAWAVRPRRWKAFSPGTAGCWSRRIGVEPVCWSWRGLH
jgi:hypothetical protein